MTFDKLTSNSDTTPRADSHRQTTRNYIPRQGHANRANDKLAREGHFLRVLIVQLTRRSEPRGPSTQNRSATPRRASAAAERVVFGSDGIRSVSQEELHAHGVQRRSLPGGQWHVFPCQRRNIRRLEDSVRGDPAESIGSCGRPHARRAGCESWDSGPFARAATQGLATTTVFHGIGLLGRSTSFADVGGSAPLTTMPSILIITSFAMTVYKAPVTEQQGVFFRVSVTTAPTTK